MNKVLPGLFLGNYRDSKDVAQLHRHRITHILAIHDDPKRIYPDKEYLCIMASDSPCQNLSQYFSASNDFIHTGRKIHGGNVLVHCLAGMSRSVTLAMAYVLSVSLFPLGEAEKIIRGARPVSNPNTGFMKQLQEFEASSRLYDERRRMSEKFPGPGGLFLESDMEYCQKHLSNYNQRLTLQHPIKTSPRRVIPPTPSPRNLSRFGPSESGDGVSRRRTPKASSTPSSPSLAGRRGRERSNTNSAEQRRDSSPPAPWVRHYGSWKDQLRTSTLIGSTATPPPSPVHYRVTQLPERTLSVTSMSSFPSVASLPAHLTPGREIPLLRRPSVSSVTEPLFQVHASPRRVRRKLPEPRYMSPGASGEQSQRWTGEEEDETLAVVVMDELSSGSDWLDSSPGPSLSTNQRRLPEPIRSKTSLTTRATLGISRWVMKRSGFRVALHSSRPDLN